MSIQQLKYVVAAIQLQSHARAAEKLIVSPQAVSKAVSDIEKKFSHKLFLREGRGVKPTPFGLLFAEKAQDVVQRYEDLYTFCNGITEGLEPVGKLAIALAVTPFRGEIYPESAIKEFEDLFPLIDLQVLNYTGDTCLRALQESIVDAAILLGRFDGEGYASVCIDSVSLNVIAHQANKLSGAKTLTLDSLSRATIAYPDDLRCVFAEVKSRFSSLGLPLPLFQQVAPLKENLYSFLTKGGLILSAPNNQLLVTHEDLTSIPLAKCHEIVLPVCFVGQANMISPCANLRDYLFSRTITSK